MKKSQPVATLKRTAKCRDPPRNKPTSLNPNITFLFGLPLQAQTKPSFLLLYPFHQKFLLRSLNTHIKLTLLLMSSLQIKKNYRCVPSLQQFYSGGPFAVSSDGSFIACANGDAIKILDSSNGSIKASIEVDTDSGLTALALDPNDRFLFSAGHSRLIRVWDLSTFKCIRSWKVCLILTIAVLIEVGLI
jgi:WD40 repeat protein